MTGWDACTLETNPVLRWFECHPGSAGWVQAAGVVIAIGFSYWLGRSQIRAARRMEDQKRDARAKALALLLAPQLADIISEAERIKGVIAHHEHGMALITPVITTRQSAVEAMSFRVFGYQKLLLRVDAFPSEAATRVVMLFNLIEGFNGYIAECLPRTRGYDGEKRATYIAEIDEKVERVEKFIGPVEESLGAITG